MPEEQASEVGILFNDFLFYWGHSTDTWQYPCTISMGQHWRWDGLLKHSVGSSHLKQQGVRIVRRIIEKQASSGQNKQESLLETGIWPTPSDWASTAIAAWKWPAETLQNTPEKSRVEWVCQLVHGNGQGRQDLWSFFPLFSFLQQYPITIKSDTGQKCLEETNGARNRGGQMRWGIYS